MVEVIAFSYAALQPSNALLDKYLGEIDKLEKQGTISERDHQLLRSSDLAQKELMNLTLGEEVALTEQTVTETRTRVTREARKSDVMGKRVPVRVDHGGRGIVKKNKRQ